MGKDTSPLVGEVARRAGEGYFPRQREHIITHTEHKMIKSICYYIVLFSTIIHPCLAMTEEAPSSMAKVKVYFRNAVRGENINYLKRHNIADDSYVISYPNAEERYYVRVSDIHVLITLLNKDGTRHSIHKPISTNEKKELFAEFPAVERNKLDNLLIEIQGTSIPYEPWCSKIIYKGEPRPQHLGDDHFSLQENPNDWFENDSIGAAFTCSKLGDQHGVYFEHERYNWIKRPKK